MSKIRLAIGGIALSATALIGIANHEAFRTKAYDDGVGVQTIGFGTTRDVKKGDTITVERALVRLGEEADLMQEQMRGCLGDIKLYQNEWDAYVSLTYNIGATNFCNSSLVKKLKKDPPDYEGACKEILKWNKAGGKVLNGLVKRRQDEYNRCIVQ